jgi:hypothetical protein
MNTKLIVLSVCAALYATANVGAEIVLEANITHDQELAPAGTTPLVTSPGGASRPLSHGTATFVLNDAQTELTMNATIFEIDVTGLQTPNDLNDNLVAAHIHVGAPLGGGPAPVRWGFFGLPDNDTIPDNLVVTPFASGVGGTFTSIWNLPEGNAGTTLASNLPLILAGLSYINFHTVQFGGGEIRGQLFVTPDGGKTGLLLGLALVSMISAQRLLSRPKLGTDRG